MSGPSSCEVLTAEQLAEQGDLRGRPRAAGLPLLTSPQQDMGRMLTRLRSEQELAGYQAVARVLARHQACKRAGCAVTAPVTDAAAAAEPFVPVSWPPSPTQIVYDLVYEATDLDTGPARRLAAQIVAALISLPAPVQAVESAQTAAARALCERFPHLDVQVTTSPQYGMRVVVLGTVGTFDERRAAFLDLVQLVRCSTFPTGPRYGSAIAADGIFQGFRVEQVMVVLFPPQLVAGVIV